MTREKKLNLVLCWHMHQPDYRNYLGGEYVLPWTYLHAIKDYTDMAYHLEKNPGAKAVFNFVPILLEQLVDYSEQFASGKIRDPLLRLLAHEDLDGLNPAERNLILDSCFRSNHTKMVKPYPAYNHLLEAFKLVEAGGSENLNYLSGAFLSDLLVWYHLAWTGESVRRTYEPVARLMAKGCQFGYQDRLDLFTLIGELISELIPRYRKLAEEGRVELSTTPYTHPIVPLLLDFNSAREAMPDVELPVHATYPGGRNRAVSHIRTAMESHRERFGHLPMGIWPAEGGISQAAAMLFAQEGCVWTASGEAVLYNSLSANGGHVGRRYDYLYKPYRVQAEEREIFAFFRDDRLSDKIGFEYSKWNGRDAANDFIRELEEIWQHTDPEVDPVVSVILDGENAWEYYPYNGYYFLSALYASLESHPHIRMTTFNECVMKIEDGAASELDRIAAGSWVYGNFSTWIGSHDKNRGWDLLCDAKSCFDHVISSGRLTPEEEALAWKQLADCEGSDWFWWFGDYNSAISVASFDALYRRNLANLYRILKLPVPISLDHVISVGRGDAAMGGAMRRADGSLT